MPRRPRNPPPMVISDDERGAGREAMSLWLKEKLDAIERQAQERQEMLLTVGEHPSPIFARLVKKFAALGTTKSAIARLLDCSVQTIETHYAGELVTGPAEVNAMVATNMLRIATSDVDPSAAKAAMDWLNRRGGDGWKPPAQRIEQERVKEGPPVIDSSKLTMEEREQLRVMLERLMAERKLDAPQT